jgi:multiple sugar transport system substrate-binding protein
MSRPSTEAEYLARLLPASVAATALSRRTVLKGLLSGAALLGSGPLLAACGGGSAPADTALTFGSNQSDDVPKQAYAKMVAAFTDPSVKVQVNTIDHNTFQENINTYLQGSPDDVFTWFAGYRMQFFAQQGLVGDISDVFGGLPGVSDTLKTQSTGADGKQYFVPFDYYPWAVYYRPSVWQQHGYTAPTTLDEFTALAKQMQTDGLTPLAFADKDGWPAMGTFDQLDLRINGYQFHRDLMAGKQSWNTPQVKQVFDTWRGLLPYHQTDALGRTWQEAAQGLQQKKAGMMVFGMFVGQQFDKGADQDDLDFFNFPTIDPAVGDDAIEAPIDGFMMRANPRNPDGAKKFLTYLGQPSTQKIYVDADTSVVAASSQADTSAYTTLQKKAVDFVAKAKSIAQFMDRDTRPDFASTVMIPALQQFLGNPNDIDGLTNSIENQKKSIFTS